MIRRGKLVHRFRASTGRRIRLIPESTSKYTKPSLPQSAAVAFALSVSVRGDPPSSGRIRTVFPSFTKPSWRPSGEKNGLDAPFGALKRRGTHLVGIFHPESRRSLASPHVDDAATIGRDRDVSAECGRCHRLIRTQEECVPIHEGCFARTQPAPGGERGEEHGRAASTIMPVRDRAATGAEGA